MLTSFLPFYLVDYRLGVNAFNDEHYDEAVVHFDSAITHQPTLRCAISRRARCRLRLYRRDKDREQLVLARTGYEHAIGLPASLLPVLPGDDYDPETDLRSLALVDALLGNQAKAVEGYDAYLLRRPNDHIALYNRANSLWRLDRTAEAENGYRQAIAALPGFMEARINLAELLIAGQRHDEGIALASETVEMPSNAQAWPVASQPEPWAPYDTLAAGYIGKATHLDNDADLLRKALGALDAALCTPIALTAITKQTRAAVGMIYLRRGYSHAMLGDRPMARLDLLAAQSYAPSYSVVNLTAAQFLVTVGKRDSTATLIRPDQAGVVVAVLGAVLFLLLCVQEVRGVVGDVTFGTAAVASLGVMLLGFSLPHLASFKLGVAEASLSTAVVTLTALELPDISAPSSLS